MAVMLASPGAHEGPRQVRLAWAGLGSGVLGTVVYVMLPSESLLRSVGFLTVAAVGVTMSWLGALSLVGIRRRTWLVIALGQLLYLVGDVLWVLYEELWHVSPYPSIADFFYLARYPLVALGLLWLIRGRRRGRDRAALLDAAIISTGFAVLGAEFLVVPAAAGGGESLLSQAVAGAYPVADLLVLAVLVRLLTGGASRRVSFWALAGGATAMLAADIKYVFSVIHGEQLETWMNVLWLAGYLLIGFAALHPSVRQLSEPTPERPERITLVRLTALGVALILAPLVEVVRDATDEPGVSVVVVAGIAVGVVLVLLRMWELIRVLQAQAVQLAALARNDGLTGIPNRRTWDHELSRACASARGRGESLSVAIADLDHFKVFNDRHGHVMGDLVLKETTAAWSSVLEGRGFLARFGGEEFTVLLHNTTAEQARVVLDRMRAVVSHDQTCSIGVATWDGREHPDALVSRADHALYHAKRTGRDRVSMHDGIRPVDSGNARQERPMTHLRTVFQPIVELATGEPIAYEALSRFECRNPREVFDEADRLGTGGPLEAAAIASALSAWTWAQPLSLNVSLTGLQHPDVQAALPADLSSVVLELTETDFVAYTPEVELLLLDLRARGARLAIDDLGTGFSNLQRAITLAPEMIKLDISLVHDIDHMPLSQAIVRAAVAYAREVGTTLCAEGVETREEQQTLLDIGVTVGQGFLFGAPTAAHPGLTHARPPR